MRHAATAILLLAAFAAPILVQPAIADQPAATPSAANVRLQAAGATFPQPLYDRLVVEYERKNPGVQISYQGVGSGAGIRNITDKIVAFAASDAPLSKKELAALGGPDAVIEFPTCAGGVVPAYQVPGLSKPLNFTGELIADMYMGKVAKWNDARLAAINPGVTLPDLAITPVYRSDGSGTTFVFTNYLCTQSNDFKGSVGMGKQVTWPVGIGGKGNPGVAAAVQSTPGALGYVEMNFAQSNSIAFGAVQNKDGEFVLASAESISAAGDAAAGSLKGNRLVADLWNQPGKGVYPISAFTYIIYFKDLNNIKSEAEAKAMLGFLWWATHDAQGIAKEMLYAPLSETVREKVGMALNQTTFLGSPVQIPGANDAEAKTSNADSSKD